MAATKGYLPCASENVRLRPETVKSRFAVEMGKWRWSFFDGAQVGKMPVKMRDPAPVKRESVVPAMSGSRSLCSRLLSQAAPDQGGGSVYQDHRVNRRGIADRTLSE